MPLAQAAERDAAAIIEVGRRAIATEAEALWALAHLDQSFADAVELLRETLGRVIVCGLGKTGHIAHKLAATLMATGTPACFLHAGDAPHGELGVMMAGDTLLILSNSGDTREFGIILRHADALGVPLIAMTSNPESSMAAAARVLLALPAKPEACPFGNSPTTSTTMMLALGDALAMALLHIRDLTAADLHKLHPGQQLGLDLVKVDDFMHRGGELPLVPPRATIKDTVELISEKGFGVAGVIDNQRRLLGIITDGDIRRSLFERHAATAEAIMTRRPRTLVSGAMARDALASMSQARITSAFVLSDGLEGRVLGLVHIHDLLRLGIA